MPAPKSNLKHAGGRPRKFTTPAEMIRIAHRFYEENLTKVQIAKLEHMETRRVVAILREAREQGIVRILINARETEQNGLATKIQNRYGLREVLIVPAAPDEIKQPPKRYDHFLHRAGPVAADLLDRLIETHRKTHGGRRYNIGITGGETALEFVSSCPDRHRENVHFYATAIVPHREIAEMATSHVDPSTNSTILWARSGRYPGHVHFTTMSPLQIKGKGRIAVDNIRGLLETLADRDNPLGNSKIQDGIRAMRALDAAFVGLGTFTPPSKADQAFKDRLTMLSAIDPEISLKDLREENFIGDLSYCPIKADGSTDLDWQFFFTAGYGTKYAGAEFFRHMTQSKRPVVAIAGPYKLGPILAALRGKLVSHLVTDERTAKEILES